MKQQQGFLCLKNALRRVRASYSSGCRSRYKSQNTDVGVTLLCPMATRHFFKFPPFHVLFLHVNV